MNKDFLNESKDVIGSCRYKIEDEFISTLDKRKMNDEHVEKVAKYQENMDGYLSNAKDNIDKLDPNSPDSVAKAKEYVDRAVQETDRYLSDLKSYASNLPIQEESFDDGASESSSEESETSEQDSNGGKENQTSTPNADSESASKNKSSLLDDYADTSTEPMD